MSREDVSLNRIGKNLERSVTISIQTAGKQLKTLGSGLLFKPVQTIQNQQIQLTGINRLVGIHARQKMMSSSNRLETLQGKLELLKPENVLKRGYSITYYNDKAVTDASTLRNGETLHTKLFRGSVEVTIEKVNKPSNNE